MFLNQTVLQSSKISMSPKVRQAKTLVDSHLFMNQVLRNTNLDGMLSSSQYTQCPSHSSGNYLPRPEDTSSTALLDLQFISTVSAILMQMGSRGGGGKPASHTGPQVTCSIRNYGVYDLWSDFLFPLTVTPNL